MCLTTSQYSFAALPGLKLASAVSDGRDQLVCLLARDHVDGALGRDVDRVVPHELSMIIENRAGVIT